MKKRKAQMQMFEVVAILFVFFLLLIIGFVVYAKFYAGGVKTDKSEASQLISIQIAQKAAELPEIQCTENGVKVLNCVDFYKLKAALDIITTPENTADYFDIFGYSTITIKKIYLDTGEKWKIYDQPLTNSQKTQSILIPTLIYDPADAGNYCYVGLGTCSFGLIEVKTYS